MTDARRESANRLEAYASSFARTALDNVLRAYPNQPAHVLQSAASLVEPRQLHPAFYGSYDWHSSVHMHWLLAALLQRHPGIPQASRILNVLAGHFTSENIATEALYFRDPAHRSFERTYGWAWLLKLQSCLLQGSPDYPEVRMWGTHVQPLADLIAQHYLDFLPLAQYPIRAGTHGNSAFGLLFALEYARAAGHSTLLSAVDAKARAWFGRDSRYPAEYEPGGEDFLSGGLIEAALMRHVLDSADFADWWTRFSPHPAGLRTWLAPVAVTDRSDPKLAHLDGLNFSRAWCWAMLRGALPASLSSTADTAIVAHLEASLPSTTEGHYAGTHWLASFALLALSASAESC